MKNKVFSIFTSLITAIALTATAFATPENFSDFSTISDTEYSKIDDLDEYSEIDSLTEYEKLDEHLDSSINKRFCYHNVLYIFDEATMTVNGVYEENTVSALLEDVAYYSDNHYAVILKNGSKVADGYLEEGMTVQIYHDNNLYGEYVISELLEPFAPTRGNGFVRPIDEMNLTTHLTCRFGCEMNGVLCSWCQTHNQSSAGRIHYGQDIAWSGIEGKNVRAVKGGYVEAKAKTSDLGNYVKIDHGGGIATLYAHMQDNSVGVSQGQQNITQATILGKVGNTGLSGGAHLHFVVYYNGTRVDPMSNSYLGDALAYVANTNTDFSNATPLSLNAYADVTVTDANQKLYYSFTPSTTGFYTFESSSITGSVDPKGWLYNSGQAWLEDYDDIDYYSNRNFRIIYHLRGGTKYYIAAGRYGQGTGSYQLRVAQSTSLSASSNLAEWITETDTSYTHFVRVETPSYRQYFKFTPTSTGTYVFDSSGSSPNDPQGWIYNSSGSLIAEDDDGAGNRNFRVSCTLTAWQTYYLVAGQYGGEIGNFTVKIR